MKIGGPPTRADFHEAISARSDRWYSACLIITRNPDMAADAVQDALLNAWNKRHQFEQSARLDTWIHRIAINAALNQIRKSKPGVFESLESDEVNAALVQIYEDTDSEDIRDAALQGMMISGNDTGILELYRAAEDVAAKKEMLEYLVIMGSDDIWSIIDAALDGDQ